MNKKALYLTPRILSLLFVGFISLFSLDVFGNYHGLSLIVALFMHLLLPLILLLFVGIAWRFGLVGAVAFIGFALFYSWQVPQRPDWILLIAGPSFIVGVLYLLDWYLKRKYVKNKDK